MAAVVNSIARIAATARMSSRTATERRHAIAVCLGLIVIVGAALRLFHLGARPFWVDEMYSVWFSQRTWSELWTLVPAIDTHPPLYYSLLKAWASFPGHYSEWWVRALSAAASILCIPVTYAVVTRVSVGTEKHRCGIAAAAAMALNQVQIIYAQDARPYAMLSLTVGLTLLGLAMFYARARAPVVVPADPARLPGADHASSRAAAALLTGCALAAAFWFHNTAVVLLGLPVMLIALGILRISQERGRDFRGLALAALLALALWSPNIRWIVQDTSAVDRHFWVQPPKWSAVVGVVQGLFGCADPGLARESVRLLIDVALGAFTVLGVFKALKVVPHAAIATILILVLPIALSTLISLTIVPILLIRPLIWVAFAQAAALGWFIALGRREFLLARAVMVAVISTIALAALFRHQDTPDPWPAAASYLRADADRSSLVVFVPNFLEFPIRWYGEGPTVGQEFLPMPAPFPALHRRVYPSGLRAVPGIEPSDVAVLAHHAARMQQVWIVSRHYELYDAKALLYRYLQCTRGAPRILASAGDLRLWRFGPATRDERAEQDCDRAFAGTPE